MLFSVSSCYPTWKFFLLKCSLQCHKDATIYSGLNVSSKQTNCVFKHTELSKLNDVNRCTLISLWQVEHHTFVKQNFLCYCCYLWIIISPNDFRRIWWKATKLGRSLLIRRRVLSVETKRKRKIDENSGLTLSKSIDMEEMTMYSIYFNAWISAAFMLLLC